MKKSILFSLVLSALLIQPAKADEYDTYVHALCVPQINQFRIEFFGLNRGTAQHASSSELKSQKIYRIPMNTHLQDISCELPSLTAQSASKKITLKTYYNPAHMDCNREIPNIDYQLYVDGELAAEDTLNFNCAVLNQLYKTDIYSLVIEAKHVAHDDEPSASIEACGYISSDLRACGEKSAKDKVFSLVRKKYPQQTRGWKSNDQLK